MIIFHPPCAEPQEYKIGKVNFTVNAYFCGFDNIYGKLAKLMQAELLHDDISLETGENPVDFEQD